MTGDPALPRQSLERTLTQADFDAFARLSGDDNPIHVDAAFAAATRFGRTVSHGMLLAAIMRGQLERLAPGARVVSQALMFPAPSYVDEALRFVVQVTQCNSTDCVALLRCERVNDGVITCQGEAALQLAQETF